MQTSVDDNGSARRVEAEPHQQGRPPPRLNTGRKVNGMDTFELIDGYPPLNCGFNLTTVMYGGYNMTDEEIRTHGVTAFSLGTLKDYEDRLNIEDTSEDIWAKRTSIAEAALAARFEEETKTRNAVAMAPQTTAPKPPAFKAPPKKLDLICSTSSAGEGISESASRERIPECNDELPESNATIHVDNHIPKTPSAHGEITLAREESVHALKEEIPVGNGDLPKSSWHPHYKNAPPLPCRADGAWNFTFVRGCPDRPPYLSELAASTYGNLKKACSKSIPEKCVSFTRPSEQTFGTVRVGLCTSLLNRGYKAIKTLPITLANLWPHRQWCKMYLVDFNSSDGIVQWIKNNCHEALEAGLLMLYECHELVYYHTATTRNTAHRVALDDGCHIVCNWDIQNIADSHFAEDMINRFGCRNASRSRNVDLIQYYTEDPDDGTYGRIACFASDFTYFRGYDEDSHPVGDPDCDLIRRFTDAGRRMIRPKHGSTALPLSKHEATANIDPNIEMTWEEMDKANRKTFQTRRKNGLLIRNHRNEKYPFFGCDEVTPVTGGTFGRTPYVVAVNVRGDDDRMFPDQEILRATIVMPWTPNTYTYDREVMRSAREEAIKRDFIYAPLYVQFKLQHAPRGSEEEENDEEEDFTSNASFEDKNGEDKNGEDHSKDEGRGCTKNEGTSINHDKGGGASKPSDNNEPVGGTKKGETHGNEDKGEVIKSGPDEPVRGTKKGETHGNEDEGEVIKSGPDGPVGGTKKGETHGINHGTNKTNEDEEDTSPPDERGGMKKEEINGINHEDEEDAIKLPDEPGGGTKKEETLGVSHGINKSNEDVEDAIKSPDGLIGVTKIIRTTGGGREGHSSPAWVGDQTDWKWNGDWKKKNWRGRGKDTTQSSPFYPQNQG